MFTSPKHGKRARLSLGTYPATPLAKARALAIEARGHVESGIDPRDLKRPDQAGPMTVAMLAESYIQMHGSTIRSGKEIARKMYSDVLPVIGDIKVSEVHRRDIHRVLDPIKERGSPAMAGKVYADLRAMFRWAVGRGYLDQSPVAGMEEDDGSKARTRFLTEEEIAGVWPALLIFKKPVELALRLALVTGQRIGEVCGITLDEIDFPKALWNIPAERSKNGEAHTVPLSDMALDIIAEARSAAIGGRLISRSPEAVAQALLYKRDRLPVAEFTAHDLRRTVCTHLAKMGVPPLHIGAIVNHRQVTKGGVTLGVYVQYDYAKEKREALELWAERLRAIVSGNAPQLFSLIRREAS